MKVMASYPVLLTRVCVACSTSVGGGLEMFIMCSDVHAAGHRVDM